MHTIKIVNPLIQLFIGTITLLFSNFTMAAPVPVETSSLDRSQHSDSNTTFGVGVILSVAQRPFIGVDDQSASLPYIVYGYKDFYIEGLNIGYKLLDKKDVSIELLATPRFYEVEPSFASNGELNGIDKTRPTYFAGISAQYRTKPAALTLQILSDLQESDGYEIIASASKSFNLDSTFTLAPALGITLQDSNLVDHFYGVQANEVIVNRPVYSGKSSTNYHVSLTAIWDASKHIQLLAQVKHEVLGSGIRNSPIVDEKSLFTAVAGVVYRF